MKPYSLSYSIKNINSLKQLFDDSNSNSYAVWGTELRRLKQHEKAEERSQSPIDVEHRVRKERRDRIERHYHMK